MTEPTKLPPGPGTLKLVADAIGAAATVAPQPPEDFADDGGDGTDGHLPEDCPVTPLGIVGMTVFYLDENRQLIALAARDHSRLNLMKLFGNQTGYLYKYWPRLKEDSEGNFVAIGWKPELVAEVLMSAAATKGIWNPADRERGVGARRGDDGELVIHFGNRVTVFPAGPHPWRNRKDCAPGVIGRYIYPAAEPQAEAWPGPIPRGKQDPVLELLTLLNTWNWKRGDIDAILLLGWIGASRLAGALKWRAMTWISGGAGAGKSTLQELLKLLLPDLMDGEDVSAASIWQTLGNSTVPVGIDEAESETDNRRLNALVKLARAAASGSKFRRGGNDHKAIQFTIQSAFLFTSILRPPMPPQDMSRMAILELRKLIAVAKVPLLEPKALRAVGQQIQRRMIDGWGRLEETLEYFRAALAEVGHTARGQDQFGILLACADILLNDATPSTDCEMPAAWVLKLDAANLVETEDQGQDEDAMLQFLLTTAVDPFRNGKRHLISHWVRIAAGFTGGMPLDIDQAQEALGLHGLKVDHYDGVQCLAMATNHEGLASIFAETHWAAKPGSPGVWTQAAQRLPGAGRPLGKPDKETGKRVPKTVYFAGSASKATIIPMAVVMPMTPDEPPRSAQLPMGELDD